MSMSIRRVYRAIFSQDRAAERHETLCGLAALERRLLLSATAPAKQPLPENLEATPSLLMPRQPLAGGATQTVRWNGYDIEAASDQWILRYNAKKLNIDKLYKRLTNFGLQSAQITAMHEPGYALMDASFDLTHRLLYWVQRHGAVKYIEPNAVLRIDAAPNDSSFNSLWGLNNTGQSGGTVDADIDGPEAWDITTGSSDVVIGVIDSGIDWNHPDLTANVWLNPNEISGNGLDDDGNGYDDDVRGWNFVDNDNNPMDLNRHGTHVAGTIGAAGNNSQGVVGVNWNVKLMPLRFLDAAGNGYTSDAVEAVQYATMMKRDHNVNIVALNNSYGGGGYSAAMYDAISAAATQNILFVAAAGNGDANGNPINNDVTGHYPSNYNVSNVISVAATDRKDNIASFSNYGASTVHLGAPGVAINSTVLNDGYASFNGTSMATPHVTGVAGLLAAAYSHLTVSEIKSAILSSVDPLASLAGKTVTGGRLNAYRALQSIVPPSHISGTLWNDLNGDGVRDGNESGLPGRSVYLDVNSNSALDQSAATLTNTTAVSIGSGQPNTVSSSINVSGLSGSITDVTLSLNITHTYTADLYALLISPNGTYIQLFQGVGGSGDNFTNTIFDDEAATAITSGSPPFSGTYRPQQPLSTLDGETPNGTWTLEVRDEFLQDGGALNSWSISITSSEPTQVTDAQGQYLFPLLAVGNYRVAQVLPAGWVQTWPGDATLLYSLQSGQSVSTADLGSYELTAPLADTGGPYAIFTDEDLTLDASSSYDGDGAVGDSIVSYAWDMDNDGQFDDAQGVNPTIDSLALQALGLATPGVYTLGLRVTDSYGMTGDATTSLTVTLAPATIAGRHLFYNHSKFDGNSSAASPADDSAIATDKQAYLAGSGAATFANYSSYSRGINGIMVDVANLHGTVTAGDFIFRAGNTGAPSAWATAAPVSVTVRSGAGANGSDRITIIWTDGTIKKQWLQVTLLATANTGLAQDDVFYFGNAVGETGDVAGKSDVNAFDAGGVRDNTTVFTNPAQIDNRYDFDRDGRVNAFDAGIARDNATTFLTRLLLFTLPPA